VNWLKLFYNCKFKLYQLQVNELLQGSTEKCSTGKGGPKRERVETEGPQSLI